MLLAQRNTAFMPRPLSSVSFRLPTTTACSSCRGEESSPCRSEPERRPKRLPCAKRSMASSVTEPPRPRVMLNLPSGSRLSSVSSSPELDHPSLLASQEMARSPRTCGRGPQSRASASVLSRRLQFPAFDAVEVVPGLFLSAHHCASDIEALRAFHVSLVVNVAVECTIKEELRWNAAGVRYMQFLLRDHSDESIARLFLPVCGMIHRQLHRRHARREERLAHAEDSDTFSPSTEMEQDCGGVLVHCRMGVSRSATLILAYLMLYGADIRRCPSDAIPSLFSRESFEEEKHMVHRLQGKTFGQRYADPSPPSGPSPPPPVIPLRVLPEPIAGNTSPLPVLDHLIMCPICEPPPTHDTPAASPLDHTDDVLDFPEVWERTRLGMRLPEALHHVHRVKPDINPNIGFVLALKDLEEMLGDGTS